MYLLKSIVLVGIAIGLWIVGPIIIALGGTVLIIVVIRYILKEHADAQRKQKYFNGIKNFQVTPCLNFVTHNP